MSHGDKSAYDAACGLYATSLPPADGKKNVTEGKEEGGVVEEGEGDREEEGEGEREEGDGKREEEEMKEGERGEREEEMEVEKEEKVKEVDVEEDVEAEEEGREGNAAEPEDGAQVVVTETLSDKVWRRVVDNRVWPHCSLSLQVDGRRESVLVNGVKRNLDLVALICYSKLKKKCPGKEKMAAS